MWFFTFLWAILFANVIGYPSKIPIGKFENFGATTQLGATHVKFFRKFILEMTPLGIKTCGESEFDIFEAKKRVPGSGKAYCVLKRKVAKSHFCLKKTPFG